MTAVRDGLGHVEVRSAYADSVTLLQVSRQVADVPGVLAAQVAMATPLNLEVLDGHGLRGPALHPQRHGRGAPPRPTTRRWPRPWPRSSAALTATTRRSAGDDEVDAPDHAQRPAPLRRRPGARLGAGRPRGRRGDGRPRRRPGRDGLQRQRAGRAGGRPQAGRRRAGAARDGARLRHRGGRGAGARLRQRHRAGRGRHRRGLRHRVPAAHVPARRGRRGRGCRARGRRPRPLRRGRRDCRPARRSRRLDEDPSIEPHRRRLQAAGAGGGHRARGVRRRPLATPVDLALLGPGPARPHRRREPPS